MDQPGSKVVNPARGRQLNSLEKMFFSLSLCD